MKHFVSVTFILLAVGASTVWAQPKPSPAFTKEFQAGVDAFRLGKYDEAKKHLETAAAMEPTLPGPHRFLAAVAQAESRWEDCIASARTAIELNPNSTEIEATRKLHDGCREADGRPLFSGEYGTGGALSVTANVGGATVTVEGLKYGATPLAPRAFAVGEVTVTAAKSGWKTATGKTKILPGVVTDLELTLEEDPTAVGGDDGDKPIANIGWLRVETVAGASVSVDGKPRAVDERGRFALEPGNHDIEITAPGRVTERRRVRVSQGQETVIAVDLDSRAVRAKRQRAGRVGLGAAVGFGAIGAMTAILSSQALDDARDAWEIETNRPENGSVPLSESTRVQRLYKRAEIEALVERSDRWAMVSYASYGLAAVSLGFSIYMYARAPEEQPSRTSIVPVVPADRDGAWGMAVTGVLP